MAAMKSFHRSITRSHSTAVCVHVREQEEEITTLKESIFFQKEDYKVRLSEKDKAWKAEIEKLKDQVDQIDQEEHEMSSSQKETLVPEEITQ